MKNYFTKIIDYCSIESLKKFVPFSEKYEYEKEYIIGHFYFPVLHFFNSTLVLMNFKLQIINGFYEYSMVRFYLLFILTLVLNYVSWKYHKKVYVFICNLSSEDLKIHKRFKIKQTLLVFLLTISTFFVLNIHLLFVPVYEKLLSGMREGIKKSTSPKKQKFDVKKQVFYLTT